MNLQRGEALGYERVLAKARARCDAAAIAELEAIGPPPYESDTEFRTQRKWAGAYEADNPSSSAILTSLLFAPSYSLMDARNWLSGFLASQDHFFGKDMKGPLVSVDLAALGPDLGVRIFIFQGTEDDYTPFELAKEYADFISAPDKQFVPAPGGGHYAAIIQGDLFGTSVLMPLRALGLASDGEESEAAADFRSRE